MSTSYVSIAPKPSESSTYMDIPIIGDAIKKLEGSHHESDVERATELLLEHFFPLGSGWAKTSQFLTPEHKRPDRMVEKYEGNGIYRPHIHVELKSRLGDSLTKAMQQSGDSLVETADIEEDVQIFSIIIKGKMLYAFEYHNDRGNLYEDNVPNNHGLVPFNVVPSYVKGAIRLHHRPHYKGVGSLNSTDQGFIQQSQDVGKLMEAGGLSLSVDAATVQDVLLWMGSYQPLNVT